MGRHVVVELFKLSQKVGKFFILNLLTFAQLHEGMSCLIIKTIATEVWSVTSFSNNVQFLKRGVAIYAKKVTIAFRKA